jgi:ribosomal protein L22
MQGRGYNIAELEGLDVEFLVIEQIQVNKEPG